MHSMPWKVFAQWFVPFLLCLVACSSRPDGSAPGEATAQVASAQGGGVPALACGAGGEACCPGAACGAGDQCSLAGAQPPSPVGYWRFDDCSASATLQDSSGNGFTGQRMGGVACKPGFSGLAGAFDGSTGEVQIPDEPAFHMTNALTVGAWVNPTSTSGLHTILNKWYGPDSYMLLIQNGQYTFTVVAGGTYFTVAAAATPNVWTHVAGVYDGAAGALRIYVNGELAAQTMASGALQQSPQPLCIGSCPSWNAFAGAIDEVWLGNAALTEAQVQQISMPAVGRWRFDDCSSASTVVDSSGNGYSGTKTPGVACAPGFSSLGGAFDGTSGQVTIADEKDFHFTNSMTVAAWVNPTNIGGLHTILNKWYAPDSYMLLVQNGNFVFTIALGGKNVTVQSPAVANQWTHVAGVYDGAFARLYVNGVPVAQAPASGSLQASSRPLCIGDCPSWNAFAGAIDEVWLGNEALPRAQIRQLMGTCNYPDSTTAWPNATSFANSDPWISAQHAQIQTMQPRVLVMNFANPSNPASVASLVNTIIAGFAEGSKPQGWLNEAQPPQLQFQIAGGAIVDMRDGVNGRAPPPAGYPYQNSTLWPRKASGDPWTFDYAKLFSASYAPYLGFADPVHPGQFLDLCTAVGQGLVHEVWVVGSSDVPDVSIAEVVGMMQMYDANDHAVPGAYTYGAGNGSMNADVPWCGRSLRIGYVNYTRGPGCYMHSYGHGVEGIADTNAIPELHDWFVPFANFDLDTKYGLPFSNLYGLGCTTPPCLVYTSDAMTQTTSAVFTEGTTPFTVNPFDPLCGNVHFAPTGTSQYDYGVGGGGTIEPGVYSSCVGYGRHGGPGGTDALSEVDASLWQKYGVYGDCGGEFLTWWYQNMPQFGSGQTFSNGTPMLSIWPNMYY
jgi:hypothetical protein